MANRYDPIATTSSNRYTPTTTANTVAFDLTPVKPTTFASNKSVPPTASTPLAPGPRATTPTQGETISQNRTPVEDSLFTKVAKTLLPKAAEDYFGLNEPAETKRITPMEAQRAAEEVKKTEVFQKATKDVPLFAAGKPGYESPAAKKTKELLNHPAVASVLKEIGRRTSTTGVMSMIESVGPKTFTQAYEANKAIQAGDPSKINQFIYQLGDAAPQTLLGVALNFIPYAGKPLATTYWTALSANEQIENKGKVTSLGNIGIDVALDRVLGKTIESLFKKPAKTLLSSLAKTFTVEGGTEVSQDLLKMSNDYRIAKTDAEKQAILQAGKDYFTSGQILMTAGVGGLTGAGLGAGAHTINKNAPQAGQALAEAADKNLGISETIKNTPIGLSIKSIAGQEETPRQIENVNTNDLPSLPQQLKNLVRNIQEQNVTKEEFLNKWSEAINSKDNAVRNNIQPLEFYLKKKLKITPEQFFDTYSNQPTTTVPAEVFYSGADGVVSEANLDLTNKKVVTINGDQRLFNKSKSYVEADQKLYDKYSPDYDIVKIEHPELPNKAPEYYNLAERKWYSPDRAVAEAYAMQSRSAKYQAEAPVANVEIPTTQTEESAIDASDKILEAATRGLPPDIGATIDPLEKIVENDTRTPLKERVGIIDYLRTPWKVFDKMGIRPSFQSLLKGYENYVAELPGNIDKITEWSKRVPQESNERIFRYLDGENITLTPEEAQVASEIKIWLSEWADRLGMAPDARISDYITHIFPIGKGGEIPEEIAVIINKKMPGSIYNPFLLQRQGAEGYIKNTWLALDAYVKRATRKVNMDPALAEMKEASAKLTDVSQINYINNYLNSVNMRPTELDTLIDNTLKKNFGYLFGARPTATWTRALRQMVSRAKIGGSIVSFAKNLTQGVNTFAELGSFYTTKGYIDLVKFGGKELRDNGVLVAPFIEDRTYSAVKKVMEKFDTVLFANMNASELVNRGAAYYGAKAKFLANKVTPKEFREALGREKPANYTPTLQDAVDYGKFVAAKTQFLFGPIHTPVALSSDIARMVAQFQTFGLKQTEFVGHMLGDREWRKLLRYLMSTFFLFSIIGRAFGMKWSDAFKPLRWGYPPIAQFFVDLYEKGWLGEDKYGNKIKRVPALGKTIFTTTVPGGAQMERTYQGLSAVNAGKDTTSSGKFKFKVDQSAPNYIRGALFGKYNLPENVEYYKKQEEKKKKKSSSSSNRYNPL